MKPITFVTEMVQRILAPQGEVAKTQTRRLAPTTIVPGDMLWVREAYRLPKAYDHLTPKEYLEATADDASHNVSYIADYKDGKVPAGMGRYRHARFMPMDLARLQLEVIDVREEWLSEISEEDCFAEGIVGKDDGEGTVFYPNYSKTYYPGGIFKAPYNSYCSLFYDLHPKLKAGEDYKLAVISFKIDTVLESLNLTTI